MIAIGLSGIDDAAGKQYNKKEGCQDCRQIHLFLVCLEILTYQEVTFLSSGIKKTRLFLLFALSKKVCLSKKCNRLFVCSFDVLCICSPCSSTRTASCLSELQMFGQTILKISLLSLQRPVASPVTYFVPNLLKIR